MLSTFIHEQAVLILGSTDFLGNPLGFLNDVSEGFSGLVSEGNLGGLFKNVTHGAANSTAKMTGALSYGLSKVYFSFFLRSSI
jgi:vacuolar protein sorting-associated protein 13D